MLEAVSSSELACSSVRCDRSALPAAISCAAERTESLPARICCSTTVSLSAKALNERAICATSSWPSAGRRLVRSPLPEPMSSIASRIIDRRRNARAVIAPTMTAATSATTTSTPIDVATSERMPAVASDLSSATTRPQSVPCTPWRCSSLAAPPTSTCSGLSLCASAARVASFRSADRSVACLSVSLSSGWATILPAALTRKPKLAGVGWMALTLAITASIDTSLATTPFRPPSRRMGTANVTTSLPVLALM